MVRALDGTNTGVLNSGGTSPDMTVDVVPYITEVKRLTSGLRTNRSRYGRYTVYQSESSILISGFNLNPASAGIYAAADTFTGSPASDPLGVSNLAADYTSFRIATAAATRSGWLGLRVDGLDSINNMNDNAQDWNSLYGSDDEDEDWNDDRYFFLFKTGDYFGPNTTSSYKPQYPAMTMEPTNSRLFGAWSSYATSDVFFASVNTDATSSFRSRVYHTYDTAEYIDIALDPSTDKLALAWLGNNSSDGDYGRGEVISYPYERTAGFWNGDLEGDTTGRPNPFQWTRDGFSNYYFHGESLEYDAELFQFSQLRTARYGDNVHWAYHDTISNTLKYHFVDATDNTAGELTNWINIDGTDTDNDGGENNREVSNGIARSNDAGEFLAMTLDDDYFPVIVYYDNVGMTLRLARTGSTAPGTNEALWTRQDVFQADDPNKSAANDQNIGKHISAIVDNSGFLHISFWSEDTGYLYYIKSSNNPTGGGAYSFDHSQIVDDSGTAGTYSDISLNRTTSEPVIAYLNSARVNTKDGIKYAYFDSVKSGWEFLIPANNTIVAQKRINLEYVQGGSPGWESAFGYASEDRFEVNYLMPEVP
jgi:hypothetical protein